MQEVKEHPILFSTPMVQALQADTKTQTRRTKGLHDINDEADMWQLDGLVADVSNRQLYATFVNIETGSQAQIKCPYGIEGDVLWVRETWCEIVKGSGRYYYIADNPNINLKALDTKWKPSIHMPKAACRIRLLITSITVQRLKDITDDNAISEGIQANNVCQGGAYYTYWRNYTAPKVALRPWLNEDKPRESFFSLWSSINGEDSLTANPWVWVVQFTRVPSNQQGGV